MKGDKLEVGEMMMNGVMLDESGQARVWTGPIKSPARARSKKA